MATASTLQPGDWNTLSTWFEGFIPGDGDTVTINHAVTVSGNTTVGTSPAEGSGTAAINVSSGATLTLNSGTLTVKGDIQLPGNNSTRGLIINAGAGIEFDASGASSPSAQNYRLITGSQYPGSQPGVQINGTSGNRCFIRANAGGGNAQITGSVNYYGLLDANFCDFTRIGDASNRLITVSAGSDGSTANASQPRFINCTFDACGEFYVDTPGNHATFLMQNCTFKNSAGSFNLTTNGFGDRNAAATWEVSGCVFDLNVRHLSCSHWTFDDNIYQEPFSVSSPNNASWVSFDNNFLRMDSAIDQSFVGDADGNYFYYDGPSQVNPHLAHVGGFSQVDTYNFTNNILEFNGTNSDGDVILIGGNGTATTINIRNNIVLPNSAGESSGTLFSALGDSGTTLVVENNTAFMGTGGGAAVGETYAGHTGMLSSFKDNLFYDTSARAFILFDSGADNSVTDLVTSANADYNGKSNFLAGDGGGYNNLEFSSGTPGSNDVEADPNFVDASRDLASWDSFNGGAGTASNAIAEMAKRNDSDFNSDYTVAKLKEYIQAGFTPQNAAFQGASSTGGDIGALAVVVASLGIKGLKEMTAMSFVAGTSETISASQTSASATLSVETGFVSLKNIGSSTVYVRVGEGSQTATTSDFPLMSNEVAVMSKGEAETVVAAICASGETSTLIASPVEL